MPLSLRLHVLGILLSWLLPHENQHVCIQGCQESSPVSRDQKPEFATRAAQAESMGVNDARGSDCYKLLVRLFHDHHVICIRPSQMSLPLVRPNTTSKGNNLPVKNRLGIYLLMVADGGVRGMTMMLDMPRVTPGASSNGM